ncbi:serine/threonine-protein kinase MPS1 isoform X5 [Aegilops tauschii subsp. strangulata]|uniref:serine/threonine-protein kinase MPS1 isoform X5 n=1 Tax=Aegilops tauschii subsp. strangulata TaxID=200361 RepID=UPI003CC8BAC4
MERRGNFLRPPAPDDAAAAGRSATFPAAGDTGHTNLTSSSGSSSSSTVTGDPLDFLGQIHAACKRQRPLGTTQRATRILLPRGEGPAKAGTSPSVRQSSGGMAMQKQSGVLTASRLQKVSPDQKDVNAGAGVLASNQNDMLTTPSMLSTITDGHNQIAGQNDQQKNEMNMFVDRNKSSLDVSSSRITSRNASVAVGFKKDQFYSVGDSHLTSQGDNYHVAQAAHDQGGKHQKLELAGASVEMDVKYDAANLPQKVIEEACNQNHGEPMTRCSVVGSSVTAVSLHSGQNTRVPQSNRYASPMQMPECTVESSAAIPGSVPPKQQEAAMPSSVGDWNPKNHQVPNTTDKAAPGNGGLPSQGQGLSANEQSTSAKDGGTSQANRDQKERRKKGYDPEHFFKVNGKLYQKLGKIGSGGSSEVHKVISMERAIYALKKIKLKGRDYPTAYGFCQEIGYLNKLKGKSNIIQLIDYEQMLEAVNTIHEERIVHSDLKPANFMLVKGSLKLIDFGIAKAIMNDTTNIQRDSQVGTLNYMSPEALLCNEQDSSGNIFKCGRPTDIWSLGCILYQMVYGKTPFADYTTFWTKFKAVTDRNHKISYEPVDNPWLIDLMQRCLAWDRDERWRIPQLLQHPFLVPLVPRDLPPIDPDPDPCSMLMDQVRPHWDNPEVARLCSELRGVIAKCKEDQSSQSTET